MKSLNFTSAPMLKIGEEYLDFHKAIRWVNNYNGDKR